ncbi:MAG TPA: lipid-binding SYLF domain-containing protein [Candidatus Binatia bacterium]|jgi:lipid-binding SYLF domain-containing protein|nr:lipid-binding SYLF domain-containing protein [Candidatus Binatia bacterium]
MKKTLVTLLVAGLAWAAAALDKPQLDFNAERLLAQFQTLQAQPHKQVPADVLARCQGIILLDRTKAGFIFAYQGGRGVALVKDKKGNWGPFGWVKANEASLGLQLGGQQTFVAILFMTEESAKTLVADSAFEFGGEARGTGGNHSKGLEGKVESIERSVLVYNDRYGVFGGAAVKGGTISADYDANRLYYGTRLNLQEILFDNKVAPTPAATALAAKLDQCAKPKTPQ